MIRGTLTILSFISTLLFPWPLTVILALATSIFDPLVPLAIGLFADTLYYVPHAGTIPLFTLYGALATIAVFFVRSRLQTSTIR